MKSFFTCIALLTLLLACGGGDSADGVGEEPVPDEIVIDDEDTGDSATAENGDACLSSCGAAADTMFSFNTPQLKLTPDHCQVADAMLFDLDAWVSVFYRADCGDGMQVYERRYSHDLTIADPPLVVSSNCHAQLQSVTHMTAGGADSRVLVAYNCKVSSSKGRTYARTIQTFGPALAPVFVEEVSISSYSSDPLGQDKYKVQWNGTANAFGLARRGLLQRLGPDANLLGGKIAVGNPYNQVSGLKVLSGSWVIFQGGTSCSKVNALGVPLCNNKSMSLDPGFLMTDSRYISLAPRQGIVSYQPFNLETCAAGERKVIGQVNDLSPEEVYASAQIGNLHEAILYRGSQDQLALVFVSRSEPITVTSELAVVNTSDVTNASVTVINGRIVVSYIEGDAAWIKVGDQLVK